MVKKRSLIGVAKFLLPFLFLVFIIIILINYYNVKPAISVTGDLNGNGVQETYSMYKHRMTVMEGSAQLWKSPEKYSIDSFSLGDVDNDGIENLVISLWKRGSFGEMKPFWHTKKDNDYKNHLFVYKLDQYKIKQVWCSSNLDRPIISFEIADTNKDSLKELIVIEGQYRKIFGSKYGLDSKSKTRTAVWEWNKWGFQLKSTSMKSNAQI